MLCIVNLDGYTLEELTEQVSRLSVSLSREGSHNLKEANLNSESLVSERLPFEKDCFSSDVHSSSMEYIELQNLDSKIVTGNKSTDSVIILSDDEVEPKVSSKKDILSFGEDVHHVSDGNIMPHDFGNSLPASNHASQNVSFMKTLKKTKETFQKKASSGNLHDKPVVTSFIDSKGPGSCRKEASSKSKDLGNLTKLLDEAASAKNLNKACGGMAPKTVDTVSSTCSKMLSDQDAEDDPLETALKSVGRVQLHVPKPTILKRQVIQLKTPFENRSGCLRKLEDPMKRFRPPRLDDWYKAILEINYFATIGLSSTRKDENQIVNKLKEVPVCFQSPEQYVEIFQPLVLEEFKAQLQNSFLEMSSWEEMFYGVLSVMSIERIDDFHIVRFVHDDGASKSRSFSENDFLLLTKGPPKKSSQDVHMVGKVYFYPYVIAII